MSSRIVIYSQCHFTLFYSLSSFSSIIFSSLNPLLFQPSLISTLFLFLHIISSLFTIFHTLFLLMAAHTSVDLRTFTDMSRLKHYEILEKLGQGTFGVVQKARSRKTQELVAIKQLINHSAKEGFPITAMREITILKQLDHTNILRITEMIHEDPKVSSASELVTTRGCFYTVSPYMSSDLVGLLENPRVVLELADIKCLMTQLLHGIQYIHDHKFLHRDIKAANILIDARGVLKIADFGLARSYHGHVPTLGQGPGGGERAYTGLVVTRWYRPPELLLGERKYTTAVDLWGVGCVFAELYTHKPILVGKSDVHQAQLVFELVGLPKDWIHAAQLPNKSDYSIGLTCKRSLETRFRNLMTPDALAMLSGLLTLDPYKRFNAQDCLAHEFFTNEPRAVAPAQLPKFEESHEIDKERFKRMREKKEDGRDERRDEKRYDRNEKREPQMARDNRRWDDQRNFRKDAKKPKLKHNQFASRSAQPVKRPYPDHPRDTKRIRGEESEVSDMDGERKDQKDHKKDANVKKVMNY